MFWDFFFDLCSSIGKKPNAVCKELGFSTAAATHWKKGVMPNGEALIKLSQYFGCSADFLLGLSDHPSQNLSEHEQELLQAFRHLSFDLQMQELGRLQLLAEQSENISSISQSSRTKQD